MSDPTIMSIYEQQITLAGEIAAIKEDVGELKAHYLLGTQRLDAQLEDAMQYPPSAKRSRRLGRPSRNGQDFCFALGTQRKG